MTIVPSESYNRTPIGRTVVRGTPTIRIEKMLSRVAPTTKAGMLMECDYTDYICKPQSSVNNPPIGWVAFEECPAAISRPDSIDTAFTGGDILGIVSGGGIEVVAWANGSTSATIEIKSGDYLVGAGDGCLTKWTSESALPPVAMALESVSISSQAPVLKVKIHVKSLI